MSHPERYEMLVLGSGAGGKLLAWQMAKSGHRTAVVERKLIGGSCPISTVFPARTRSGAPRSLIWFTTRIGSEL